MTNCELKSLPLLIPSLSSSEGLELRINPPVLTPARLEELHREHARNGKLIFLDEFAIYAA